MNFRIFNTIFLCSMFAAGDLLVASDDDYFASAPKKSTRHDRSSKPTQTDREENMSEEEMLEKYYRNPTESSNDSKEKDDSITDKSISPQTFAEKKRKKEEPVGVPAPDRNNKGIAPEALSSRFTTEEELEQASAKPWARALARLEGKKFGGAVVNRPSSAYGKASESKDFEGPDAKKSKWYRVPPSFSDESSEEEMLEQYYRNPTESSNDSKEKEHSITDKSILPRSFAEKKTNEGMPKTQKLKQDSSDSVFRNLSHVGPDGKTLFMRMVEKGYHKWIKKIFEEKLLPDHINSLLNTSDTMNRLPLHVAVQNNDIPTVEVLLDPLDPELRGPFILRLDANEKSAWDYASPAMRKVLISYWLPACKDKLLPPTNAELQVNSGQRHDTNVQRPKASSYPCNICNKEFSNSFQNIGTAKQK